ncbi:MAG TPA: hypothetical protein VF590_11385 [Isosphaeraceae bacterium]|jgi:hypothetical protein
MAGLKSDAKGNRLVPYGLGGKQFTKSAGTKDPRVADAVKARVEATIFRMTRGYIALPEGAGPGEFIVTGGQRSAKALLVDEGSDPEGPDPR